MTTIFAPVPADRLRGSRAGTASGVVLHIALVATVSVGAGRTPSTTPSPRVPSLPRMTVELARLTFEPPSVASAAPRVRRLAVAASPAPPPAPRLAPPPAPPLRAETAAAETIVPPAHHRTEAVSLVEAVVHDPGPAVAREPPAARAPQAPVLLGGFDRPLARDAPRVSAAGVAVVAAGLDVPAAHDAPRVSGAGVAVAAAGFDRPVARPAAVSSARVGRAEVPVEIVFKPAAAYTDEARRLRVEGTVVLDVEFAASSTVRVLRVVSGLGHGLDESARLAAMDIRFNPARHDGVAVDVRTTVHIVFRLT